MDKLPLRCTLLAALTLWVANCAPADPEQPLGSEPEALSRSNFAGDGFFTDRVFSAHFGSIRNGLADRLLLVVLWRGSPDLWFSEMQGRIVFAPVPLDWAEPLGPITADYVVNDGTVRIQVLQGTGLAVISGDTVALDEFNTVLIEGLPPQGPNIVGSLWIEYDVSGMNPMVGTHVRNRLLGEARVSAFLEEGSAR